MANSVPVAVNAGPPSIGYVNGLFTSVTVCVPGSSNCQTIDSVLVDTGSIGLRVMSSSAGGELSLTLPRQMAAGGDAIVECNSFVDSYTWGPVELADLTVGGEHARSLPIQVIGDPGFPNVPAGCTAGGVASADSLQSLGANAILGVAPFPQDCGGACAESPTATGTQNPGTIYYTCPSSGCQAAAVDMSAQVQNPVSAFPTDNNGVLIDLSSISAGGASNATGSLVFGIGTQANNGLGSANVVGLDPEMLTFTTVFSGQEYPMSVVDSGSNGLYFLDSKTTSLPLCTITQYSSYYCPATTMTLSATNMGANGANSMVSFTVANASTLFANETAYAFDDVAGPSSGGEYFDWGLPFFFGRKVFTAIEGAEAPGGQTPYVAY
jgi:hypothetical protein